MRARPFCSWRSIGIGAVSLLIILLIALRHHISDVLEVIHTYSTFYKTLDQHPALIFRYDPLSDLPSTSPSISQHTVNKRSTSVIPKIIHQIYLTNGRQPPAALTDPTADYADINNNTTDHPPSFNTTHPSAQQTCRALHPTWEFRLWTDDAATAFLAAHHPTILPYYQGYAQTIQRANVLRYAILATYGGVYLDLDIACRVPLDPLIDGVEMPSDADADETAEAGGPDVLSHHHRHRRSQTRTPGFLTPAAYPAGVNNAFILARPGHPFLQMLLARLPAHAHRRAWALLPYVENMLSTGCMFFSNAWVAYVQQQGGGEGPQQQEQEEEDPAVYVLADRTGDLAAQMLRGKVVTPLFLHGGASSWHGWDAAAIVFVGAHYGWLLLAGGLVGLVVVGGVGMWMVVVKSRHSSRSRVRGGYTLLGAGAGDSAGGESDAEDEEQMLSKEV